VVLAVVCHSGRLPIEKATPDSVGVRPDLGGTALPKSDTYPATATKERTVSQSTLPEATSELFISVLPLKRASLSTKCAHQINIACERVVESEAAQASHRSSPSVVLSVRDKFVLHRLGQARASFEESIVIQAALTRRLATNTTLQHPLWTVKQTLSELIQHPNNFDQVHQIVSETLNSSCLPKTEAKALLQQCRPGST
jgi:hypothetical protein